MTREFFKSPFRIQQLRGGQDGHLLDVFTENLRRSGFAQITARRHIRARGTPALLGEPKGHWSLSFR